MRGLAPRIHRLRKTGSFAMDCRVKPGNDASWREPLPIFARFACLIVIGFILNPV
jgi:hypothetical protein